MLNKLRATLENKPLKLNILSALCAVIAAISSFFGYSSPLSSAVVAFLPIPSGIVFLVVYSAVEIALGINAFSLAAVMTTFAVLSVRVVKQKLSVKNNAFTQLFYPPAIYLLTSFIFLIAFGGKFGDYLVAFLFSSLIFAMSSALKNPRSNYMTVFLFFILTASLSCLSLSYINIGRAFGIYSVITFANVYERGIPFVLSVALALATSFHDPELFASTLFTTVIAVVCSFGGANNKLRRPLYAITSAIICAYLSGMGYYEIGFVVDTLIAVTVFIFTEEYAVSCLRRFQAFSNTESRVADIASSQIGIVLDSLSFLDAAIKKAVPDSLGAKRDPLDLVYTGVCLKCDEHDRCFCNKSYDIKMIFNSCKNFDSLVSFANVVSKKNTYDQKLMTLQKEKLSEASSVIRTITDVMKDVSIKIDSVKNVNEEYTKRLAEWLRSNRAEPDCVCVYNDLSLFIEYPSHKLISETRLCICVSEMMSIDYGMPEVILLENKVRYCFYPPESYIADYGFAQISAELDACGDCIEFLKAGNKLLCILCDGMGTGAAARKASHRLASVLRELLDSLCTDAAISLSSLVMRLIALDECFSTLDLISIELNTGKLEFYKSGACQSILIEEGTTLISGGGYPIGILADCEIKNDSLKVSSDAVIVMLSDGAKDISEECIRKTVEEFIDRSSEEIADNILKTVLTSDLDSKRDDITVAVIKLKKK